MSLLELVDNQRTDKNTLHSYLDLYETLLFSKKETAKHVLEVGVCLLGGSIKLWSDYFKNATVYGLDTKSAELMMDDIKYKDDRDDHDNIDITYRPRAILFETTFPGHQFINLQSSYLTINGSVL